MIAFLPLVFYAALTAPLAFWPGPTSWLRVIGLGIYSLLSLGLSIELSEALLALLWKPRPLPISRDVPPRRDSVAVLMTLCDDASHDQLLALLPLARAGYRVFVLDDSKQPAQIPRAVHCAVTVVRRPYRAGAKAGNLNHWLSHFGARYEFCILLDSDSVVSLDCADTLLRAAHHPQNAAVAVFQAKILPDATALRTWVQRILAVGARVRTRIHERVHARMNVLLSFGHNQLLRLSALRHVGCFDESVSAEDTALSLRLAASGWRVGLVDAWSCDTDPRSVGQYVRRTTRWARQTVELFRETWRPTPLRLKLTICWHLLSYAQPVLSTTLLLISIWAAPEQPGLVIEFTRRALTFHPGYELYGVSMWPGVALVTANMAARIVLSKLENVKLPDWVAATLLGGALQALLVVPLACGMLASLLGRRVVFRPTNARAASGALAPILGGTLVFAGIAAGVYSRPGGLYVGLNWFWCAGMAATPLFLLLAIADEVPRRASAEPRREPTG